MKNITRFHLYAFLLPDGIKHEKIRKLRSIEMPITYYLSYGAWTKWGVSGGGICN